MRNVQSYFPVSPKHVGDVSSVNAVLHPLHGARILAVEDVAASDVVGEALDRLGSAESADDWRCLEEREALLWHTSLEEETTEGEAGDAGAEDGDLQLADTKEVRTNEHGRSWGADNIRKAWEMRDLIRPSGARK